jgi:hypothetical protein
VDGRKLITAKVLIKPYFALMILGKGDHSAGSGKWAVAVVESFEGNDGFLQKI